MCKSLKETKGFQRFQTWAVKPNLIVEEKESNCFDWKYGWNLDETGPTRIVEGFSNIKVKSEYRLIGYRYIEGGNGNGIVWAIPVEAKASKVNECEIKKEWFLSPPKPKLALKKYMEAIDGDKSPLSYLQAAILNHELGEYGACWHGVSWGRDSILPWINNGENGVFNDHLSKYKWDMNEEEPEIIEPHFYCNDDDEPVIVFHTINDIGIITFNEYKHIFNKENYGMRIEHKIIGTAGMGIVF